MESKGAPRNRSPTRMVRRMPSTSQKDPMNRSQSRGRQPRSRTPSRNLSSTRGRSGSPTRKPPNRTQSFGRKPPNRTQSFGRKPPNRTQSFGRKPPNRTQSFGPQRGRNSRQPPNRAKSSGGENDILRRMQKAQRVQRARSASPSMRMRSRSEDSNRGKSVDRKSRTRTRSRSNDHFSDELIRKNYPSQRPEDNGISKRRLKSFKRLKKIGGRGKELTTCQICSYLIPIAVIFGASIGMMFATGNGSIITDFILDNSDLMDPFGGGNAPHWPENGKGLKITIINALSDDWQITFKLAIADWSMGEPDAVEITQEKGIYDKDCEAPDGKVIVCNGDYGDSKWRGVNKVILNPRRKLMKSSARMNEYYLSSMERGAWQYTMCHELGHTLGLGHTDEDFNNEDLGNCMDYTDNLNANKHPDKSNYEKLASIYGTISGIRLKKRQLRMDDTQSQSQRTQRDANVPTTADASVVIGSSPDQLSHLSVQQLRRRDPLNKDSYLDNDDTANGNVDIDVGIGTVPDHIHFKEKEAVRKLFHRIKNSHADDDHQNLKAGHTHKDGWKLVHRKHHGEQHEMDLGEGYKVRVQFLLAH